MAYQLNQQDFDNLSQNPLYLLQILQQQTGRSAQEFRVQSGRKVIWGQMVNGEFRTELNDPNYVEQILEGLKQTSDLGEQSRQASQFRKIPEFQISVGQEVLFRQEADGKVSVNAIQIEVEESVEIPSRDFTYTDAFSSAFDPIIEVEVAEEEVSQSVAVTQQDDISAQSSLLEVAQQDDISAQSRLLEFAQQEDSSAESGLLEVAQQEDSLAHSSLLEVAQALNQEYEDLLQSAPPIEELKVYLVKEISATSEISVVEGITLTQKSSQPSVEVKLVSSRMLQQQLIEAATAQALDYDVCQGEVYQVSPPELETVEFWSSDEAFAVVKDSTLVAYGFWQEETLKVLPIEYLQEIWSQLEKQSESSSPNLNLLKRLLSQIPQLKLAQLEVIETTLVEIQQQQQNQTITSINSDILKHFPAQPEVALANGNAFKVLHNALQNWNPSKEETKQWVSRLAQGTQQQYETTKEQVEKITQTINDYWQKGQLLSQQLQSSLESEEVQQALQQIKDKTSEGVVSLGNWIATRPEAIATHRLMREAFEKFNQGHNCTLESRYQVGDYQISKRGQNLFTLSQSNQMLLQFTVQKNIFGQDIFALKGKASNFEAAGALKQLQRQDLEVTGSLEASATFELLKQQMLDKLLRLRDGTCQLGNYTLNKQGETYQISNGKGEALDPQTLTLAQVKRLSEGINSLYRQQQVDACMPVLAKHLQLQGKFHEETDKRVVSFNQESQTLSYHNKLLPQEFLLARWLGEEGQWRHQEGELSEAKERELLEVVSVQQKAYEQQEIPLQQQRQTQEILHKQELEV